MMTKKGRDQLRKAKQAANVQLGTYVRPSMPKRRHAVSQPSNKKIKAMESGRRSGLLKLPFVTAVSCRPESAQSSKLG